MVSSIDSPCSVVLNLVRHIPRGFVQTGSPADEGIGSVAFEHGHVRRQTGGIGVAFGNEASVVLYAGVVLSGAGGRGGVDVDRVVEVDGTVGTR